MKYILTFLISMVPLVELRGAVPFAISRGIPLWQALAIGVIGNMLPIPIIFFFARHILAWGADKPVIGSFFTWCLNKGHKGGQKLEKAAGDNGIFWALLLFVGIPLPGTGAWTGTLAASILDWDFKRSVLAVMLGVILAGLIMGILSLTWTEYLRPLITKGLKQLFQSFSFCIKEAGTKVLASQLSLDCRARRSG